MSCQRSPTLLAVLVGNNAKSQSSGATSTPFSRKKRFRILLHATWTKSLKWRQQINQRAEIMKHAPPPIVINYDPAIAEAMEQFRTTRPPPGGNRAPLHSCRAETGSARGAARHPPGYAPAPRSTTQLDRTSDPRAVRSSLHPRARKVPADRQLNQGDIAVSPKFKMGLGLIACLAVGSVLFHILLG